MTWQLTDEQLMIREMVREAAEDKIAPRSKGVDETAEFPMDLGRPAPRAGPLRHPLQARIWRHQRLGADAGGRG